MAVSRDANTEARERLVGELLGQGVSDPRVLDAFWAVPRHLFVDAPLRFRAYDDVTLPIGFNQTLSRPSVVGRQLTRALRGVPSLYKVLEIGTGSGYQTALLTHLCTRVYSIERIQSLHARATERLAQIPQKNYRLRHGDGFQGWAEQGPFDLIVAAASPEGVPQTWLDQLSPEGRLLAPIGPAGQQRMICAYRSDGDWVFEDVAEASFVPCLPGAVG